MEPTQESLTRVAQLYSEGKYLQAYTASEAIGPLKDWHGAEARLLAGRLASVLGSPRLGRTLHWVAWREAPAHLEARYYYALDVFYHRGPWRAWRLLKRFGGMPEATAKTRADWCALWARVLASYRDFENAGRWIAEALQIAPDRPWIHVEHAAVLEAEDHHQAAFEAANQALTLRPWYRPAVQATAYYLTQLNRDEEALELLTAAVEQLECGVLLQQLASLQTELGLIPQAKAALERAEQSLPLLPLDKQYRQMLLAQRSDAAYQCGDFEEAACLAEQVPHPFFQGLVERLRTRRSDHKRVLLPVGFVRQHHITCVPATLSALSGFWGQSVDHLEVAEKICYDGTPSASERKWAEENGFLAREFRITWDSAVALLDRGIPFTLTTVAPTNAHLQAVIGYDDCRESFIIRDPTERHYGEGRTASMLEHFRSTGPRGMAMVPRDRAELLTSVDLPEAGLYDELYRLERALQDHRRDEAAQILARMREIDPDHRLSLRAQSALASYDTDLGVLLQSADRLLEQFPDDPLFLLSKLGCLSELGRREDRITLLQRLANRRDCEPLFWRRYAEELKEDAREHPRVLGLLRRSLRYEPLQAEAYQLLADILWTGRRRDEALTLYRFAACLDDKNEDRARTYFIASRACGQADVALGLLTDRFRRFGARSSLPARTLCWAYEQLEDVGKLFEVLEAAIRLRPQDGDLLLFAADAHGRYGKAEEASQFLERGHGKSRYADWLRTAASLALYRGDQRTALEHWRKVVETQPLARDAHSAIAGLLADLEGQEAAVQHLREVIGRFPHCRVIRVLLIEWLGDDAASLESAVREFLEHHPTDAWARRELAIAMLRQGKWDAAGPEADTALQLDPSSPVAHLIRGRLHQEQGQRDEAMDAYRKAICLSVDYEPAINALVSICETRADRERELRFISQELVRQVIFGDGLLTFREQAATTLDSEEVLGILREALTARPDLWHAHAALTRQLTCMQQTEEAMKVARRAAERFPLLPRIWYELALVCAAQQDREGEIEALVHALQINPSWSDAAQRLAEAHRRQNGLARARSVLEQAIALEPRNATNHGLLADVLWVQNEREAALERMHHAVRLAPGYEWAWQHLRDWTAQLGRPEVTINAARQLAHERPRDVRAWIILAQVLRTSDQREEGLAALEHVLELSPRHLETHDLRATYLAEASRFEEALAACRPEIFGSAPPLILRARAADIEARRGNVGEAITQMRAVVRDDPDCFWAWMRLADWYDQTSQRNLYLKATQELVRLAPQEAIAWGYRGHALRRTGERQKAIDDFRRAIALDRDYRFASQSLLDMLIEDHSWKGAIDALRGVAPHLDEEAQVLVELHTASLLRNQHQAIDCVRKLCHRPLEDSIPMRIALEIMRQRGWTARLERVLAECLNEPTTSPNLGKVWVGLCVENQQWWYCARRLKALAGRGAIWLQASGQYLAELARAKRVRSLRGYLHRYAQLLRRDVELWAMAGDLLLQADQVKEIIRWMANWRAYPQLESKMLFPLAYALWKTKRYTELTAVCQHAIGLPRDDTTPYLAVILAIEAMRAGRMDQSRELVNGVECTQLNEYYRCLHGMLKTVTDSMRPSEKGKAVLHWEAKRRLHAAMGAKLANLSVDTILSRVYYLCRWRLAQRCGRYVVALWARLKMMLC